MYQHVEVYFVQYHVLLYLVLFPEAKAADPGADQSALWLLKRVQRSGISFLELHALFQ